MRIPRVCGLKNCFLVSMFFANSATILSAQEVSAPIVREATARVAEPTMETLALMRVWQPGDPKSQILRSD